MIIIFLWLYLYRPMMATLPVDVIGEILDWVPYNFIGVNKRWHRVAALSMMSWVKVWHHRYYIPTIKALFSAHNGELRHLIAPFTRHVYTHEIPQGYDWRQFKAGVYACFSYTCKRVISALRHYQNWIDPEIASVLDLYIDVIVNNKPYPF